MLAKLVTLINAIQEGVNIMFKSLFANDSLRVVTKAKKTETRGRKTLSKRQKVLNLLSKGESVTWKTLRNKFDLVSPRALVDTLRAEGNMIYVNQTAKGTSYRWVYQQKRSSLLVSKNYMGLRSHIKMPNTQRV